MTRQPPMAANTIRFIFAARSGDAFGGATASGGRSDNMGVSVANHVGAVENVSGSGGCDSEIVCEASCVSVVSDCKGSVSAAVDSKDIAPIEDGSPSAIFERIACKRNWSAQ